MRLPTEDEIHEKTERAKHILRFLQSVLTHWVDGVTAEDSAARLEVSLRTVKYARAHLRLSNGQAWRAGKARMGRAVKFHIEVRP